MSDHLVIGAGEVGSAIAEVLETRSLHDPQKGYHVPGRLYDFMHICIPFSRPFPDIVTAYQERFRPICTVVHSTVPIGTCDRLGAVHSPVRGKHPDLAKSIRTFVKYFGGLQAETAAKPFEQLSIPAICTKSAKDTEALKLWDTAQYGLMIQLEKEIHRFCVANGLDFDLIYSHANQTYNSGYRHLGLGHVQRPILGHHEGPIGGHCVVPNAELLKSWVSDVILRFGFDGDPSIHEYSTTNPQ